MKRYDAINMVSKSILDDGLVEAIFLKGSIARNEDDNFSDVDMYAVVLPENENKFLENRLKYMEAYMPLVYWSESNFVGPQIVGVYENALHFDLYTVRIDRIPQTDNIKIIYDENGILNSYKKESLSLATSDVSLNFNEFTFSLLEFEIAYSRGNLIWAIRLASHLTSHIAMILAYIYNKENSKLGIKCIQKFLTAELREEFIDILNCLTPNTLGIGINKLINFANELLQSLPQEIKDKINVKFFNMMKERFNYLK